MRKILLIVTAALEIGAGAALFLVPSALVEILLGVPLEGPAPLLIARLAGAALIALSVTCWLGNGDVRSRTATGLIAGMSIYNAAAAGLLTYAALGPGLVGILLWPAVLLHVALLIWCLECLRRK